jgi:hypothetical protein
VHLFSAGTCLPSRYQETLVPSRDRCIATVVHITIFKVSLQSFEWGRYSYRHARTQNQGGLVVLYFDFVIALLFSFCGCTCINLRNCTKCFNVQVTICILRSDYSNTVNALPMGKRLDIVSLHLQLKTGKRFTVAD